MSLARRATAASAVCLLLCLSPAHALAQAADPKPGFNLFSVEQDIEIGRQSAAEAEKQLPILRDAALERYLNTLVRALAANAPGARYPYRVRPVNSEDINAFTFPGGFLYVNRGLVEAARNESELAGVLAHEVSHVALRHGTHQASKAYAAQAGLGILGGLLGRESGSSRRILETIGGVGLNAVFLKFSRNAEYEADLVGARILHRSGYNPVAMADFFEVLREQRERDPSRLEQFFSSHPAPADRAARLRAEAGRLGPAARPHEIGGFAAIQDGLRDRPASTRRTGQLRNPPEESGGRSERVSTVYDPPSSRVRTFRQRSGFFEIDYPENWRAHQATRGYGVVIAPGGGIQSADGRQNIVHGVVVNHYDPFGENESGTLDESLDDLVSQILRGSSYLRVRAGSERQETIDGARGRSVELSGRSPLTGVEERVTVLTRELGDGHVLYALLIAPGSDYSELRPTFERMVDSLRINDRAAHR